MKKIAALTMACIVAGFVSHAQCDKNIKWSSSKSDFIDNAGNVKDSREEKVSVTTSQKQVSIVRVSAQEQLMSGDITDYSCNWKNKENGKTSFKSVLLEPNGTTRHATITIEAINGKTTIMLVAEEENTTIKLNVDSFEEVK